MTTSTSTSNRYAGTPYNNMQDLMDGVVTGEISMNKLCDIIAEFESSDAYSLSDIRRRGDHLMFTINAGTESAETKEILLPMPTENELPVVTIKPLFPVNGWVKQLDLAKADAFTQYEHVVKPVLDDANDVGSALGYSLSMNVVAPESLQAVMLTISRGGCLLDMAGDEQQKKWYELHRIVMSVSQKLPCPIHMSLKTSYFKNYVAVEDDVCAEDNTLVDLRHALHDVEFIQLRFSTDNDIVIEEEKFAESVQGTLAVLNKFIEVCSEQL